MKLLMLFFISMNVYAGSESANSESILKKYVKEVKVEKLDKRMRFSYCPDNTCDLLELKTSKQEIAWDAGLFFLFNKSTYTVLEDFKKKTDVLEHTQKLGKKYKVTCDQKEIFGDCIIKYFVKKYSLKQLFARYDEGKMIIE